MGLGYVTDALHWPVLLLRTILVGQVIVGLTLSVTVTVNWQVDASQPLVAVRVTVVTPLLKAIPLPVPLPLPRVRPVKA